MIKKTGWNARRWTKKEDEYLRKNYLKKDYHEIAKELDRNYSSINERRYKLGLTKKESGGNVKKPTCNKNVKKEDCIYLAGLFDGEGSVSIKGKNKKLACRWAIGMQEEELMKSLKRTWNCGINYTRTDGLTYWAVNTREDLKILLPQVIPYMRIKEEKSEKLLNILKNYKRGEMLHESNVQKIY